jgi:DNA-binding NarL/FixJ family response regulator
MGYSLLPPAPRWEKWRSWHTPSIPMDMEKLRVIVVDDHIVMRRGIELLLRSEGMRIAGVAGSVDGAREILTRRDYDVALIDIRLGAESALGLVAELLRSDPAAAIVLYTGYIDSGLADAVRLGARGFVLKTSPSAGLLAALRAVASGGAYVDPDIAALVSAGSDLSRLALLTSREREIFELLAQGLSGQAVAERLFVSLETVRTHIRNGSNKLGAATRVQAVALVLRSTAPDRRATEERTEQVPAETGPLPR